MPIILWPGQPHEMTFLPIPAGRFRMGSRGYETNEEPRHMVEITRPFWMAETPVTQAQYRHMASQCLAELAKIDRNNGPEPSHFAGKDSHPVETVSWDEAQVIAVWLSRCGALEPWWASGILQPDECARLPTEAQWEYACRAGTETEYYTGDGEAALREAGWFDEEWSTGSTRPVKSDEKKPNAFGLHDMHGNVWEWCQDVWDEKTYARRSGGAPDPVVAFESPDPRRVFRGGSWGSSAGFCRSAYRDGNEPGIRFRSQGFRLCVSPGPAAEPGTGTRNEQSRNLESQARDEPETEGGGGADWTRGASLPAAQESSA